MKKEIHPKYFPKAKITCSCGNIIETGSTIENQKTELCSACHPFFTGKQKQIDSGGRIDKFLKKTELAETKKKEREEAKIKHAEEKKEKKTKEMKKKKK